MLRIVQELAGVLPRSVAALKDADSWNPLSLTGIRQLGEVSLDEAVVTGMTLMAPPPQLQTHPDTYARVADELSGLGVAGAYTEPEPLRVRDIRRRRAGLLEFEQLTYEHDPLLPSVLDAADVTGPATAVCNLVRHDGGPPRPWLVWIHGAGMGGLTDFAAARIGRIHHKLGYNIALPVQPGHGPRRNTWPTYPDTDPVTNVAGMMRVVSEVRAVTRWLAPQSSTITVSGLSLGSAVAALVASREPIDAVAVYTPITGLNGMIADHLHRWGSAADEVAAVLHSDTVARLTSIIDPVAVEPLPPPHHRLIVGAWHDQMAMRGPALALHERWGGQIYWHDGGHVGHLFAGGVQRVTEDFLSRVSSAGRSPG